MIETVSRGLILRVGDHGESDKLVTLLSPDLGRAGAIAKGAKRSKQRFVNKLEPFTVLEMTLRPSRSSSLLLLAEAELIAAHLQLRRNYFRYGVATYLSELLLKFTREGDADPALFALSCWALSALDQAAPSLKTAALFHVRLLMLAGYGPQISHCGGCGQPASQNRRFAMPTGGGDLICDQCRRQRPGPAITLSARILQFIADGSQLALPLLNRLQLPEREAWLILQALHRYSQHILQQDLHSWRTLVEQAPPPARQGH